MSSDDELYGRPGLNAEAGYTEMSPDPRVPREDDENPTWETDQLEDAANELSEVRKLRGAIEREPLVERAYVSVGGEDEGTPRPAHETVTAERAADDLARQRASEVAGIEQQEDKLIADAVDEAKGVPTQAEAEEALLKWHQEQLAAQAQQEEQQSDRPPGMSDALYTALREPAVQQALQAEIAQTQAARKAYAEGAFRSAQLAAASLVAAVPELQGIAPEQMSVALQLIEKQNPEKGQAIRQHLGKVEYLFNVATAAKAEQTKLEQHRAEMAFNAWKDQESKRFDAWAQKPDNAQRIQSVMPQAVKLLNSNTVFLAGNYSSFSKRNPCYKVTLECKY